MQTCQVLTSSLDPLLDGSQYRTAAMIEQFETDDVPLFHEFERRLARFDRL